MNCVKCKAALPEGAIYCPMCGKKQVPEKRKALKRANGTGTVYKLQGRRKRPWVAAKNKVVIGYYERKTDALETLERLSGKDLTERYNMTFSEVFEAWKVEHYKEIGPKGVESYDRAFAVFSPIHEKKFRDLRTADFQSVLDAHMKKSHSTVSKYKQLLTQMSQWAIREEICTTNFAKFVRLPENTRKEKEIFSDADIAKLERDGSETAKIILMLIYTGMRIGELFYLPLQDYYENYVIGGEKTEAGRNRIIPIRPEGRPYFEYFAAQADGPYIFMHNPRANHYIFSQYFQWFFHFLFSEIYQYTSTVTNILLANPRPHKRAGTIISASRQTHSTEQACRERRPDHPETLSQFRHRSRCC